MRLMKSRDNIFDIGMLAAQWQSSLSHSNLRFRPICIAQSSDQKYSLHFCNVKRRADILW